MAGIPLPMPECWRPVHSGGAASAVVMISALMLTGCDMAPTSPADIAEQPASDDAASNNIMTWPDLLDQPKPVADATISYGDDPLQLIDVWIPKGDLPHRAVIMIHGGCWQSDIAERDIMNYIADDLRQAGIGVWNIEYRGVDRPGGGYPGSYLDVAKAADLFGSKGAQYGFSDRKLVVIGHSAGGHLALWLAMRPDLPLNADIRGSDPIKIDAAISQGGLPDLRDGAQRKGHPCGTDAPGTMSGGKWRWSSPPEMPIGSAQQFLFNNDRDQIAPPGFANGYQAQMAAQGKAIQTIVTPDEGHVELIAPRSKSWAAQKAKILQLLTVD